MPHSNHVENGGNICWRRDSVKRKVPLVSKNPTKADKLSNKDVILKCGVDSCKSTHLGGNIYGKVSN